MSECKLDHSLADVMAKYESQSAYLPEEIKPLFVRFCEQAQSQDRLNRVFHLLKKYDLASEEEKKERTNHLYEVLKSF